MLLKAPEGCTGINIGGEQFDVDEKTGNIEVPDEGNYLSLAVPHGFTVAPTEEQKKTPWAPKAKPKDSAA